MGRLDRLFAAAFVLVTGAVAALVLLAYDLWEVRRVTIGLMPNWVWTGTAAALVSACAVRAKRMPRLDRGAPIRLRTLVLLCGAVLCAQAFVCAMIYREQLYDAIIVLNAAYCNAMGYPQYRDVAYFSRYPNNLFLLALETAVLTLLRMLGIEPGMDRCTLLFVLGQCVLNAASGVLTVLLAQHCARACGLSGRETGRTGRLAWGLWLVLIGTSAWLTVIYSDSMTVLFPVLLLYLYTRRGAGKRAVLMYAAIGCIGGLAFKFKPQSGLSLIAMVLVDACALLARRVRARTFLFRLAAMAAAAAMVFGPGTRLAQKISQMELDPQQEFGVTHFLNLGLNTQTHGIFSPEDLERSQQAQTKAERDRVNLQSAKQRLEEMGPAGLAEHLFNKTMINFADGSFQLDDFLSTPREEKQGLERLLEEIFHHDGVYRPLVHTVRQGAWVLVLMLCPFAALAYLAARRGEEMRGADAILAMMLTVTGVMVFNMLFEARGRYIFSNVPVMIALAVTGFGALMQRVKETSNPQDAGCIADKPQ